MANEINEIEYYFKGQAKLWLQNAPSQVAESIRYHATDVLLCGLSGFACH
jgi:hypothetical protein